MNADPSGPRPFASDNESLSSPSPTRWLAPLGPLARLAAGGVIALCTAAACGAEHDPSVFGEVGRGDVAVTSATIGATASLWPDASLQPWDVYGEFSLGRWNVHPHDRDADHHVTQIGLTPVVRYTFGPALGGVFLEVGIGVNAITPIFMSRDRSFSTTFEFGDHVGIGKRFGTNREHEVSLRIQHYSNAGIKHPNPGEDLGQLRYAYHF